MANKSALLYGISLPILFWTIVVLAITYFGYPGVICMTPVGWLLALPAAQRYFHSTNETGRGQILRWSAAAGALVGLYQGILVAVVLAISSPFNPSEAGLADGMASLSLALVVSGLSGAAAGAMLGSGIVSLEMARRK